MMSVRVVGDGSRRCYELPADPVVAAYLALGNRVIWVDDGLAYQVALKDEVASEATSSPEERTFPVVQPTPTTAVTVMGAHRPAAPMASASLRWRQHPLPRPRRACPR